MRHKAFEIVLLALLIGARADGAIGVCELYRSSYQNEIKAKIQAGVPFELMSAIFADGELVDKVAVRVSFNLWDEVVTLKSGDRELTRFALGSGENEICRHLELTTELLPNRKYVYRLLLNPLWSERMARLQIAARGTDSNGKLVGVNWQKLASEMPADRVLVEKEIHR